MTNRELALETASRFTDRHRFTVDTMLRNAEKIEEWLNRDVNAVRVAPEEFFNIKDGKLLSNPLGEIATGYHYYVKLHGTVPTTVFCRGRVLKALKHQLGEVDGKLSFQMYAVSIQEDNSLAENTLRFTQL